MAALIPDAMNPEGRRTHGASQSFRCRVYPRTAAPQTEDAPFAPRGRKAAVRARIATLLLEAMADGTADAVICRPEPLIRVAGLVNQQVREVSELLPRYRVRVGEALGRRRVGVHA